MSAGAVFSTGPQGPGGPLKNTLDAIRHAVDMARGHVFVAFHNHAPQVHQHLNNAWDLRGHR